MREYVHIRRFKENCLQKDEVIIMAHPAALGTMWKGRRGAFVVTNKRVIFYYKRFWKERLDQIPISKIAHIEQNSFFRSTFLKIHTSGGEPMVISTLPIDKSREFQEYVMARQEGGLPATA